MRKSTKPNKVLMPALKDDPHSYRPALIDDEDNRGRGASKLLQSGAEERE